MPQLVLSVLFVIYLVVGYKMPEGVAVLVDSNVGKIVVVVVALMLFAYSNPILGVLALSSQFELTNQRHMSMMRTVCADNWCRKQRRHYAQADISSPHLSRS